MGNSYTKVTDEYIIKLVKEARNGKITVGEFVEKAYNYLKNEFGNATLKKYLQKSGEIEVAAATLEQEHVAERYAESCRLHSLCGY